MSHAKFVKLESRFRPGSTRELLAVAVPLMISYGSQSLMQFVDRMYLTWYSQAELAATMPAGLLGWTVMSLAMGVASYAGTFVAQYEGAGNRSRVVAVVWQSIWLSLLMGVGLAIFSVFAPAIFAYIGHPQAIQQAEVTYFSMLLWGAPASLLMTSLSSFFSGRNQTAVVMGVNLAAVVVNLCLDYWLIFGWGSIPAGGIFGAALATVLANIFGSVLLCVLVVLTCVWQKYPLWQQFGWDNPLAWRMVRFGAPMGTQTFVDIAGFTVFSFIIGNLGVHELAASNLAFNLNSLAFIPMLGLGIGVMTLVGRRVGEQRPEMAQQSVRAALGLGFAYMGVWIIAYLFLPYTLMMPFAAYADGAEFAKTQQYVVVLLRFIAVYSLFDALAVVHGYAVRGAGDVWFPLMIFSLASLLCLIVPCLVIYQVWGGNLYLFWGAATFYIMTIGVAMAWRFHSGAWKRMRVIESADELAEQSELVG